MMCGVVVRASAPCASLAEALGCHRLPAGTSVSRQETLAVISLGDWVVALFFAQGWMCDE
uniref:Uncharacterized protein n=1 Tax=Thermogemmatispora argillosa TaxID=2045280 RepID=A0A455T2V4_9CHLR|nr:hypothetical protein KTA_18200 [Thermogemmatispora argillosa]